MPTHKSKVKISKDVTLPLKYTVIENENKNENKNENEGKNAEKNGIPSSKKLKQIANYNAKKERHGGLDFFSPVVCSKFETLHR